MSADEIDELQKEIGDLTEDIEDIMEFSPEEQKKYFDSLAEVDYEFYVEYVNPEYVHGKHTKYICQLLQDAVESGERQQLIITMPPQHSKSYTITETFPSWYLGHNPTNQVIAVGYSTDFAEKFGRQNLSKIKEFGPDVFSVKTGEKEAYKDWLLDSEGRMISSGIGGQITGERANCLIIDDPIKNRKEANNRRFRDEIWSEWESTLSTRLAEDAIVILIMCMTGDTRIMMADGTWKHLDTINVGEEVLTWKDGELVKKPVEAMVEQGSSQVLQIETGNHKLKVTKNHPFLVHTEKEYEWVKAGELEEGMEVVVLGKYGEGGNPYNLTREDMWMLGFMYGGGWITHHNHDGKMRWKTCIAKGEYKRLNKRIESYFEDKFGVELRYKDKEGYYQTEVAKVGRWFESLGFAGKAKTKRIPDHVFQSNLGLRESFINGLISADGCIGEDYYRANITLSNELLIEDLKLLAESCGFNTSNIHHQEGTYNPPNSPEPVEGHFYNIQLSMNNRANEEFTTAKIRNIKLAGVQPVYDLTVKDTHNFIAEGVVTHNTRWHEDDLAGRLLEREGNEWTLVEMPALSRGEDEDILNRPKGEPLWPSQYSKEYLKKRKEKLSSKAWNSLYMCSPNIEEGNQFKSIYFRYFREDDNQTSFILETGEDKKIVLKKDCICFQTMDSAFKQNTRNDYTVISTWYLTPDGDLLLYNVYRDRLEVPDLWPALNNQMRRFDPQKVFVEDKASGTGLVQKAKREGKPVLPINVEGDKITKSFDISNYYENRAVFHKANTEWTADFEDELVKFPNATYDDQVDTASIAGIVVSRGYIRGQSSGSRGFAY